MKYTLRTGHTLLTSGTLAPGNTIKAEAGATLIIGSGAENDGLIALAGAADGEVPARLRITGLLTNNGTIVLDQSAGSAAGSQGVLGADGELVNAGALIIGRGTIASGVGATLAVAGTLQNLAGATIQLGETNPSFGVDATGSVLAVSGRFDNAGSLKIESAKSFRGTANTFALSGTVDNSGIIDAGDGTGVGPVLIDSGVLVNSGEMIIAHGGLGYAGGTLEVSGILINTGVVTVQEGASSAHYFEGRGAGELLISGVLINQGTVQLNGARGETRYAGGVIHDAGTITNAGTIQAQTGARLLVSGGLDSTGIMEFSGGTGHKYIDFYHSPGAELRVTGTLTNEGSLTLDGGADDARYYYFNGIGTGAHLRDFDVVQNTGLISVRGGRIVSAYANHVLHAGHGGSLIVSGTLSNNQHSGQAGIFETGTIETGTIELHAGYIGAGGTGTGGVLIDSGRMYNGGTIVVDTGIGTGAGTLQIDAGGYLRTGGVIAGGGVLVNHGTILIDPTGPGSIGPVNFFNDGTLLIGNGSADIAAAIGADLHADDGYTGAILLEHATLTVGGPVAASQSVRFEGGDNLLVLATPVGFSGTLAGLAAGDTLDIGGLNVTSVTADGTTLELVLALGGTLDYALAAPVAGVAFTLSPDRGGGTDIVISDAPGHLAW